MLNDPDHRAVIRGPVAAAVGAVGLCLAVVATPVAAQDAAEILERAIERQQERIATVDNYTVVQEVEGHPVTAYYEKRTDDATGLSYFVRVGPMSLARRRGEAVLPGFGNARNLREAFLNGALEAGLDELWDILEEVAPDRLIDILDALEDPYGLGAVREGDLAGLADTEALRRALLTAAKRAGISALRDAAIDAATDQLFPLLGSLRSFAGLADLGGLVPGHGAAGGAAGPVGALSGGLGGAAASILGNMAMGGLQSVAMYGMQSLVIRAVDGIVTPREFLDETEVLLALAPIARVAGTESVDGRDAWVLVVDDPATLRNLAGADASDFRPISAVLHIDRSDLVTLRMTIEGEARIERDWQPIAISNRHGDYREVDGMLHPFRSVSLIEGFGGAVSEDERRALARDMEEFRQQMAEVEKQLAELPPEQRRMAEQLIAAQMPQMEQVAGVAETGDWRTTTVVLELHVNSGPM